MIDAFLLCIARGDDADDAATAITNRLIVSGGVPSTVGKATLVIGAGTRVLAHDRAACAVIGQVFRRDDQCPLAGLDRGVGYRIAASGGQALIDDYWGGYVSVIMRPDGGVQVVRDPSGTVPAYWLSLDGFDVVFSDLALLLRAGIALPPFNWPALAHHLRYPTLRAASTGLAGISEILPGQRLTLKAGLAQCDQLWSPWTFAARPAAPIARAAGTVAAAVLQSTIALTAAYPSVQLELSGGLDSSILAACLAERSPETWRGVTFATRAADGEERPYARAVAQRAGVALEEFILEESAMDPLHVSHVARVRPGGFSIMAGSDTLLAASAHTAGVAAIVSGGGGDNVFCTINSAAPVLDAARDAGVGAVWSALRDVALLNETTILDAAVHAFRHWRRGRAGQPPWPLDDRYLAAQANVAFEGHPWLAAPAASLPGKRAHVANLLRFFPFIDGYDRFFSLPTLFPLMSQPVLEACLAIPTWQWIAGGRNRAVARDAFATRLPEAVHQRRSKGGLESLFVPTFLKSRTRFIDLLGAGQLATRGLIDIDALLLTLHDDVARPDGAYTRILQIADVELWIQSIDRLRLASR